MNRYYN